MLCSLLHGLFVGIRFLMIGLAGNPVIFNTDIRTLAIPMEIWSYVIVIEIKAYVTVKSPGYPSLALHTCLEDSISLPKTATPDGQKMGA